MSATRSPSRPTSRPRPAQPVSSATASSTASHPVQPIPTRYMRRQTRLKTLFGRLSLVNIAAMALLLLLLGSGYAWKVSVARKLDAQTTAAKQLYEENMSLDVALNKLKSLENIDARLARVPNLVAAKEKRLVQSTEEDWQQPLLLGQEALLRHPEYKPLAGF